MIVLVVYGWGGSWAWADVASKGYVDEIVAAIQQKQADWSQTDQTAPDYIKNKPDVLTANEINTLLESKANVNDARFNTIPTSEPSGNPPAGQVFIWFN